MISHLMEVIYSLDGFIRVNFDESLVRNLVNKVEQLSLMIAEKFETLYPNHPISELALDLAINTEGNIDLIEINVNKPGVIYYQFVVANLVIPYFISLAEHAREKQGEVDTEN